MGTSRNRVAFWCAAAVCAFLVSVPAAAQGSSAARDPAAAQNPPASSITVEQLDNGWVIAPDARFTQINDRTATLVGAYGGWLTDKTLLVGAGAYWLANRDHDFKMAYYGGVGRWTLGGHRKLGVSTGGLIGFGDATLSRPYGEIFGPPIAEPFRNDRGHHGGTVPSIDTPVRIYEGFFIAEPQVNALWNITPWMRVDAGVSYRFIGAADLLGDELRGPSGTIAIQFGGR